MIGLYEWMQAQGVTIPFVDLIQHRSQRLRLRGDSYGDKGRAAAMAAETPASDETQEPLRQAGRYRFA